MVSGVFLTVQKADFHPVPTVTGGGELVAAPAVPDVERAGLGVDGGQVALPVAVDVPGDISEPAYGSQPGPTSIAPVKPFAPLPFQTCSVAGVLLDREQVADAVTVEVARHRPGEGRPAAADRVGGGEAVAALAVPDSEDIGGGVHGPQVGTAVLVDVAQRHQRVGVRPPAGAELDGRPERVAARAVPDVQPVGVLVDGEQVAEAVAVEVAGDGPGEADPLARDRGGRGERVATLAVPDGQGAGGGGEEVAHAVGVEVGRGRHAHPGTLRVQRVGEGLQPRKCDTPVGRFASTHWPASGRS
ncbi:hypothetical protein GCM10020220_078180 [Nonomuraea rubra]